MSAPEDTFNDEQVQSNSEHVLERQNLIIQGIHAGIWDWDIVSGKEWWSPRFYELLGYKPDEIPATYATFIDDLVHPKDRSAVEKAIKVHLEHGEPYHLEIRMRLKSGEYHWFQSTGKARFKDGKPLRMVGSIIDAHEYINHRIALERSEDLLTEASDMAKVGGWFYNIDENRLHWTKGTYDIHNIDYNETPNVEAGISYYVDSYKELVKQKFYDLLENAIPFDIECQFKPRDKAVIWVRAKGKAVTNLKGEVIAIQGVFMDIDESKQLELEQANAINLISDQNKRLLNFTHIVSHNLRSHSSNISMLLEMIKEATADDKQELFVHLEKASSALENTISDLNEVVRINNRIDKQVSIVRFDDTLDKTMEILHVQLGQARLTSDFHLVPSVKFIAAYMDSIFLNLLTNSLKYADPNRAPEVRVFSRKNELGDTLLVFEDNGLGIDLEKHGKDLFGMYKTFHKHKEANGVGLFLVKNQVESLGGKIEVKSEVGKGTRFTFIFPKELN